MMRARGAPRAAPAPRPRPRGKLPPAPPRRSRTPPRSPSTARSFPQRCPGRRSCPRPTCQPGQQERRHRDDGQHPEAQGAVGQYRRGAVLRAVLRRRFSLGMPGMLLALLPFSSGFTGGLVLLRFSDNEPVPTLHDVTVYGGHAPFHDVRTLGELLEVYDQDPGVGGVYAGVVLSTRSPSELYTSNGLNFASTGSLNLSSALSGFSARVAPS